MANETLKHALADAGLTIEQFADVVGVNPKTVQRWVAGRPPYPRHRETICRALDLDEHELWPDETPAPDDPSHDIADAGPGAGDVTGSWARADDPTAPDLVALVAATTTSVDVLAVGWPALHTRELVEALCDRADAGVTVRVLAHSASAWLRDLIGRAGSDVRVSSTDLGNSLVRVDDRQLVSLRLAGQASDPAPVLQLERRSDDGLFERLARHYQLLWDQASTTLATTAQLDEHLAAKSPPPPGPASSATSDPTPVSSPLGGEVRHWPGRRD